MSELTYTCVEVVSTTNRSDEAGADCAPASAALGCDESEGVQTTKSKESKEIVRVEEIVKSGKTEQQ